MDGAGPVVSGIVGIDVTWMMIGPLLEQMSFHPGFFAVDVGTGKEGSLTVVRISHLGGGDGADAVVSCHVVDWACVKSGFRIAPSGRGLIK